MKFSDFKRQTKITKTLQLCQLQLVQCHEKCKNTNNTMQSFYIYVFFMLWNKFNVEVQCVFEGKKSQFLEVQMGQEWLYQHFCSISQRQLHEALVKNPNTPWLGYMLHPWLLQWWSNMDTYAWGQSYFSTQGYCPLIPFLFYINTSYL
jgi:hypothetical protein